MLSRDTWNHCTTEEDGLLHGLLVRINPSGCWLCKIRLSFVSYMMIAIGAATPGELNDTDCNNNNNNNNSHDNVYGAVIITKVIARVHLVHLMNVD